MATTAQEPALVGREAEQRRLADAVARVFGGSGAAVFISGEAGIGKTLLARHGLELAADRGFQALEGRAYPLDQSLAYAPIVEALGRSLRSLDAPERARVTQDLPALGRILEGIDLPAPEPLGSAALEKTRLFEAVLRLLDRLSRRAPVAFFADDLHWFDPASLEMLAYTVRDLPGLPILLVGTYRNGDALEDSRLAALLLAMRRTGVAEDIALGRLTDDEMGELANGLLGGRAPMRMVEFLVERSGGVPLFAEELVRSLRADGTLISADGEWALTSEPAAAAPPLVRDVLRDQLETLTMDQRRLVDLIAVGGDDLPEKIVRAVAGASDPVDASQEAVWTDMVSRREEQEVTYRLRHPLIGEVAYAEMPAGERRRLHARFAEVYEDTAPDEVDRIARHYQGALPDADVGRVLDVSLAAGTRALAQSANAQAVRHLEVAADLARRNRPEALAEALIGLGEAKSRVGDLGEAVGLWEEAISVLESANAQPDIARLHRLMAQILSDRGDFREADRHVAAGLAALESGEPSDKHVELLLVALFTVDRRAELADVQPAADRVIEMAARVSTPRSQLLADVAEMSALLERADYDRALRVLQRLGPVAADDNKEFALRQHTIAALIALARGDLAAAGEAIRRSTALTRHIGIPRWEYRSFMYSFIDGFYSGDWDRAQETLQELALLIETTDSPRLRFIGSPLQALLSAARADFETADRCLRAMDDSRDLERLPADPARKVVAIFGALVALERGDPVAALGQIAHCDGHYLPGLLPPWGWVARGEAEARTGLLGEANETAADLSQLGPVGSYPDAAAVRIRGIAAASAGEPGEAIEHLARASDTLARLGMPFETARCDIELGEVAVRADEADETLADRLARSYETTTRLGADRYAGRARRLLHSLGRPVPVQAGGGLLTPRQLEVAELVATGMSNAEIAEVLFISVRTVTSHLDHIYTRLGISSRTALAAHVAERRSKTLT